jgi:hypothetical protein
MLIPVLIFLVCFSAGVVASSRWLPDLAAGSVAGLAFFLVSGLLGAAAGLLGVHVYIVVEELKHVPSVVGAGAGQGELVAGFLRALVFDDGSLLGFAAVVYLLAPVPDLDLELEAEAAS